ncbi:MAG: hypothetical protein ABI691_15865 [Ginsengibacter sp.]
MRKSYFIFILLLAVQKISFSQDTLPKISVAQISNKVLISWTNPYTSITNIGIQRSYDSTKYFTTIGSVLNVKAQSNGFIDAKAFLPAQYYRLFISFEGGTYLFTESHRPGLDTMKVIPNVTTEIGKPVQPTQPLLPVQNYFVPSREIYTGLDNNIVMSLPDADKKKYSVKFFEDDGTFLFEIKKIAEPYLTVDKVNFVHAGLFRFELFDNRVLIERHKFYIPKDGKPIPLLDEQGYELK